MFSLLNVSLQILQSSNHLLCLLRQLVLLKGSVFCMDLKMDLWLSNIHLVSKTEHCSLVHCGLY